MTMRKGELFHVETVDGPWAAVDIEIRDAGDGRLGLWEIITWKANCGRAAGTTSTLLSIWRWELGPLIKEARLMAAQVVPR